MSFRKLTLAFTLVGLMTGSTCLAQEADKSKSDSSVGAVSAVLGIAALSYFSYTLGNASNDVGESSGGATSDTSNNWKVQQVAIVRDEAANYLANPEAGITQFLKSVIAEVRGNSEKLTAGQANPLADLSDGELAAVLFEITSKFALLN